MMYSALSNQAVRCCAFVIFIVVTTGVIVSSAAAHEAHYPVSVHHSGIADVKHLLWSYDCDTADPAITTFDGRKIQLDTEDFEIDDKNSAEGDGCLTGEVTQPSMACFLKIPFKAVKGRAVRLSFKLRGDGKTRCAVWCGVGEKGRAVVSINSVSPKWQQVDANFLPVKDGEGEFQLVAPSSHGVPPGRAWIDDIEFYEMQPEPNLPDAYQDEPVLARDKYGKIYLAVVDRSDENPRVLVYRCDDSERTLIATIADMTATGIEAPDMVVSNDWLYVVTSMEIDGVWKLAVKAISLEEESSEELETYTFGVSDTVNRNPAITASCSGKPFVAWEADVKGYRSIYATRLDKGRPEVEMIRRVSPEKVNANNPDIADVPFTNIFVVYDAVDEKGADLFVVRYHEDKLRPCKPVRLTNDPRIERHASIKAAPGGGTLWLAWQSQSYGTTVGRSPKNDPHNVLRAVRVNNVNEQRIVVACFNPFDDTSEPKLLAPLGLFEHVSTANRLLLRPQIIFDLSGRLWLTARMSTGQHTGWAPVAWCYDVSEWSEMKTLHYNVGRYRPIHPIQSRGGKLVVACQTDNLPNGWGPTRGIHPGWLSAIVMRELTNQKDGGHGRVYTLALKPLEMPETTFSLPQRWDYLGVNLPRQTRTIDGEKLTLLFGDFHDHSDMSVCARATNPPVDDLYANERDIERIDFLAITDHGYNLDRQQWEWSAEHARQAHQPGKFVTFLAQEWTSSKNGPALPGGINRYGHHNLIFLDPYHDRFYDAFDGDVSPRMLWDGMAVVEYLCIPHQLADWQGKGGGNPPTDWNFVDEHLQPVAEIYQARQSYEYLGCPRQAPAGAPFKGYYLQDAWAKGIIIGVIASPDHGGGCGKIGAWAKEFTREGIFEAVRARRTFGTSHPKMSLLFRTDANQLMGEVVIRDNQAKTQEDEREICFNVEAITPRPIKEVVIFRNNEIVYRSSPDSTKIDIDWTDEAPPAEPRLWYYARVECTDDELAWSSPIWFMSTDEREKSKEQNSYLSQPEQR